MIEVEKYLCSTNNEARGKTQYYINELNADLNSRCAEPLVVKSSSQNIININDDIIDNVEQLMKDIVDSNQNKEYVY